MEYSAKNLQAETFLFVNTIELAISNTIGKLAVLCMHNVCTSCGALVQFGCYQHRYEWEDLWCSYTV